MAATAADAATYARDGCVLLRGFLSPIEVADLHGFVSEVEAWGPAAPGTPAREAHTLHYEQCPHGGGPRLCRVENLVAHAGLASLARVRVAAAVDAVVGGGPHALYKEKLNVKPPLGGRGYAAHYDGPSAAAVGLATRFTTAQVAVDPQLLENGCMQVVRRAHWPAAAAMVPPVAGGDPDRGGRVGAIPEDVADELEWEPIECAPGDVLIFDHWMPHRSAMNRSDAPRRTLYLLYTLEGDFHDAYYERMAQARADYAADLAAAQIATTQLPQPKGHLNESNMKMT